MVMSYILIGLCLCLAMTVIANDSGRPINWQPDGFLAVVIAWPLVILLLIYFYFDEE
tara:strand:- start:2331 stop:2501 length:171 start_codon:yes stop_codon:yes gene_type:complete